MDDASPNPFHIIGAIFVVADDLSPQSIGMALLCEWILRPPKRHCASRKDQWMRGEYVLSNHVFGGEGNDKKRFFKDEQAIARCWAQTILSPIR